MSGFQHWAVVKPGLETTKYDKKSHYVAFLFTIMQIIHIIFHFYEAIG